MIQYWECFDSGINQDCDVQQKQSKNKNGDDGSDGDIKKSNPPKTSSTWNSRK